MCGELDDILAEHRPAHRPAPRHCIDRAPAHRPARRAHGAARACCGCAAMDLSLIRRGRSRRWTSRRSSWPTSAVGGDLGCCGGNTAPPACSSAPASWVALGILLWITGVVMADDYHAALAAVQRSECLQHLSLFRGDGAIIDTVNLTIAAPLVLGLFWGAPLIAREIETGTHTLVWTQGVSRRRWLAGKLSTAAARRRRLERRHCRIGDLVVGDVQLARRRPVRAGSFRHPGHRARRVFAVRGQSRHRGWCADPPQRAGVRGNRGRLRPSCACSSRTTCVRT